MAGLPPARLPRDGQRQPSVGSTTGPHRAPPGSAPRPPRARPPWPRSRPPRGPPTRRPAASGLDRTRRRPPSTAPAGPDHGAGSDHCSRIALGRPRPNGPRSPDARPTNGHSPPALPLALGLPLLALALTPPAPRLLRVPDLLKPLGERPAPPGTTVPAETDGPVRVMLDPQLSPSRAIAPGLVARGSLVSGQRAEPVAPLLAHHPASSSQAPISQGPPRLATRRSGA